MDEKYKKEKVIRENMKATRQVLNSSSDGMQIRYLHESRQGIKTLEGGEFWEWEGEEGAETRDRERETSGRSKGRQIFFFFLVLSCACAVQGSSRCWWRSSEEDEEKLYLRIFFNKFKTTTFHLMSFFN